MSPAARILALAALILCATPAFAQTAPGQESPLVADKGTTAQLNCDDENNRHMGEGNHLFYRIEMTNKCEQHLECAVFAYAVTSKGPSKGRATLVLASISKGAAPQIYDFKVKGVGGMTTASRECRVF